MRTTFVRFVWIGALVAAVSFSSALGSVRAQAPAPAEPKVSDLETSIKALQAQVQGLQKQAANQPALLTAEERKAQATRTRDQYRKICSDRGLSFDGISIDAQTGSVTIRCD
jgi:hypothetical protein